MTLSLELTRTHRRRAKTSVRILAILMTAMTTWSVAAQSVDYRNPTEASRDLSPTSLVHKLNPIDSVATMIAPALDLEAIEQEDIKREMSGMAPRFAIPLDIFVSPQAGGSWEAIDADTWVWRLRIQSPGAHNLYLGFTRFEMPASGQLFIYSTDGLQVVRGFTQADNEAHGQLWTPVVLTDDLTIELTIDDADRAALELELTTLGQGYRGFGTAAPDKSGSCNVDVVCPEGDLWQGEIQSVAVIGLGSGTFCTGFMVNNTAQDRTPYFMTADHCGINAGNAPSLVAYWNYETSVCGGTPDGVLNEFNTGSVFRAGSSASDFSLVELDDDPDPISEVTFAGWDRSDTDPAGAIAIHHPSTDEKRISFEDDPTQTTSYLSTPSPGDGSHLRVIDWDLGTTEPGSSGSPLFSPEHRVVGQLHGGFAACGNDDSDWYGRFSVSWIGGGTSSTRLSNWLDPLGTGQMTVNTLGQGLGISPLEDVVHFGEAGGPFTPPSVTYTLTNTTGAPINYSVSLTNVIGLLLNGGTTPVVDVLLDGASDLVTISVGPTVNGLAAGIYDEVVVFNDATNGIINNVAHDVEVGQTLITTTPAVNLVGSGPVGGPFTENIVYTVTSQRPTSTSVRVSADASWISINGGPGPHDVVLSGTGDDTQVTIGFSSAANVLAAGQYAGQVTVENLSGGGGFTTRDVTLDVGRFGYASSDTPQAIPDSPGGPLESTITVPDGFCVGDVDVSVDITHTWSGDLSVELESPGGVVVVLHNQTGGDADDVVQTYDDDGGTAPDGPGTMADFEITESAGIWTLRIMDNVSQDFGTLNSWQLSLALDSASPCPTPEVIADYPFDTDPGWARQGLWTFGVPLGLSGDPISGFTGSNVFGYNLSGNYADNTLTTNYLTTGAIDLTGYEGTKLSYYRWLGIENATFDHANVQISTDGVLWSTIWEHTGGTINETSWILITHNIGSIADDQATVYFRWGLGPTDSSVSYHGWNLDDVLVTGFLSAIPCPADVNDSGDVTVLDLLDMLANWGACPAPCPEDINNDGQVNITDLLALLASWGACP